MELLNKTQVGRDINRPYLHVSDIQTSMQKPVVKALCELIKLRNTLPAFNGEFSMSYDNQQLQLTWINGDDTARLIVDFAIKDAQISVTNKQQSQRIVLTELLAKHQQ